MLQGKTVSLIIPCRNEGKIIGKLIRKIPKIVDEIIVIDNKSTDDTVIKAKKAGAKVYTEDQSVNGIGYGFAHLKGLNKAKGNIIFALDGDDTYPVKEIPKIAKLIISKKFDFISCNRLPLDNPKAISPTRKLGIQILNWEVIFLYGYLIQDILTGMWALKREIVPKLNLKEGGWDLSPEIKISALNNPQIKFAEYHVPHFSRDDSNVSKQKIWQTGFNHLKYIAKRRFTTDNPFVKLITSIVSPALNS